MIAASPTILPLTADQRQILIKAKEALITYGWTQGQLIHSRFGSVCAAGAIRCGLPGTTREKKYVPFLGSESWFLKSLDRGLGPEVDIVWKLRSYTLVVGCSRCGEDCHNLTCWNDVDGRTLPEVLALFDKALA